MKRQRESELKSACLKYLTMIGAKVVPIRSVGMKKPDGTWIPYKEKGVSDILGVYKGKGKGQGKAIAIEVKIKPNKPTDNQLRFISDWILAGGYGMVVYDTQDLIDFVEYLDN